MSLFAYDGRTIAICEGRQLLIHDGETEAPLWRKHAEAALVAVGLTEDAVVTLDAGGRAARWELRSGEHLTETKGPAPQAGAIARDGSAAIVHAAGVAIIEPNGALCELPF